MTFFFAAAVLVLRDVVFLVAVEVRRVVFVFAGDAAEVPRAGVAPAVVCLRDERRVVVPFWCGFSSALRCGTMTSW